MNLRELREAAGSIARAAIRAVDPEVLIRESVKFQDGRLAINDNSIDLGEFKRIIVVGAGKAGVSMARALEDVLGDRISAGTVIVTDGLAEQLKHVEVLEAGHPLPDERGTEGSRRIVSLLRENAGTDTLVLCLISGGGSSLMPLPPETVPLSAKHSATKLLLECGATIDEINAVRKHLSKIKGGQLAREAVPARLFSLILSDVVGDPLDVIASGPTVGDPTTFSDARAVMEKYNIWLKAPGPVRDFIEMGLRGDIEETPKPGEQVFGRVTNLIIGNNRRALLAAASKAKSLGFRPLILSTCITGEAKEVGKVFASIALEAETSGNPVAPPACILGGGETTVTVRGDGKGGRNQELALSAALKLCRAKKIIIAGIGTDGADGPTNSAGAIVDTTTIARARQMGLDPLDYLGRNDSYNFFLRTGDLLVTGPTGTNVMDLLIALVG